MMKERRSQGTLLLEVLAHQGTDPKGHWLTGKYVVASDSHMRWWMSEGEGRVLAKKGSFHFCEENAKRRGRAKARLCTLRSSARSPRRRCPGGWQTGARLGLWGIAQENLWGLPEESYLGDTAHGKGEWFSLPWQKPGDETDDEEDSSESSDSKGFKERLEKAREELKRLEKREQKKKKKKKAKVRARASPAREKAVKKKKKTSTRKEQSPAEGREGSKKRKESGHRGQKRSLTGSGKDNAGGWWKLPPVGTHHLRSSRKIRFLEKKDLVVLLLVTRKAILTEDLLVVASWWSTVGGLTLRVSLFKMPPPIERQATSWSWQAMQEEAGQIGLQDAPEDGQGISPRVGGGDRERPQSNATCGRRSWHLRWGLGSIWGLIGSWRRFGS